MMLPEQLAGGALAGELQGMQALRCAGKIAGVQAEIGKLMPSYGTARNPIDVTAHGVTSGGLQTSVDLLTVSDEVDAILVVLSLSSDVRKPFKEVELTPVLASLEDAFMELTQDAVDYRSSTMALATLGGKR